MNGGNWRSIGMPERGRKQHLCHWALSHFCDVSLFVLIDFTVFPLTDSPTVLENLLAAASAPCWQADLPIAACWVSSYLLYDPHFSVHLGLVLHVLACWLQIFVLAAEPRTEGHLGPGDRLDAWKFLADQNLLRINFRVFNFRPWVDWQKSFYDENFQMYGMTVKWLFVLWSYSQLIVIVL